MHIEFASRAIDGVQSASGMHMTVPIVHRIGIERGENARGQTSQVLLDTRLHIGGRRLQTSFERRGSFAPLQIACHTSFVIVNTEVTAVSLLFASF